MSVITLNHGMQCDNVKMTQCSMRKCFGAKTKDARAGALDYDKGI